METKPKSSLKGKAMEEGLKSYLAEKRLRLAKKERISKGYSSEIYLVKGANGERYALKIEKAKSPRQDMAQKESSNLKLANSLGIGPRLIDYDLKKGIILMEYISGPTFRDWLFGHKPKKQELQAFITALLKQAEVLDKACLSHGQLAGKGTNILVRNCKPVIIDFEKASQNRKCHNLNQLRSFLFENKHSAIVKEIEKIMEN